MLPPSFLPSFMFLSSFRFFLRVPSFLPLDSSFVFLPSFL
jgi:hypothetical protein